jgi:Leucine-rich repeat (LRR) protein
VVKKFSLLKRRISYFSIINSINFLNLNTYQYLKKKGDKSTNDLSGSLFQGLTSLERLTVTGYKGLTRIDSDTFTNDNARITHLDLSYNGLEWLEPAALLPLANLVHLNLATNRLSWFLFSACLRNTPVLERLLLAQNRIDSLEGLSVDAHAFTSLLRVLDLSENRLVQLPPHAFLSLPSLVSLDLHRNRISEVDGGAFDGLSSLSLLDLSSNAIKMLDLSVFDEAEMARLLVLDLRGNMLELVLPTLAQFSFFSKCRNRPIVYVTHLSGSNHGSLEDLARSGFVFLSDDHLNH